MSKYLRPTPNDTKGKQFLTSLFMTIMFIAAVGWTWGLHCLARLLRSSQVEWVQTCGLVVYIGFWVSVVIVVLMTILSMFDWMLATSRRPETLEHVDTDSDVPLLHH